MLGTACLVDPQPTTAPWPRYSGKAHPARSQHPRRRRSFSVAYSVLPWTCGLRQRLSAQLLPLDRGQSAGQVIRIAPSFVLRLPGRYSFTAACSVRDIVSRQSGALDFGVHFLRCIAPPFRPACYDLLRRHYHSVCRRSEWIFPLVTFSAKATGASVCLAAR